MQTKAPASTEDIQRNAETDFSSAALRDGASGLSDNRPQALAQQRLTQTLEHSPRQLQQAAKADMMHNSPRVALQESRSHRGGMPAQLKSGIESLSGISMDDVAVHYNSSQPAQLNAHAYAQGGNIYLGPGQERHLPHEAWHVVQQMQGRVLATNAGATPINDDAGLEREADEMGGRALQAQPAAGAAGNFPAQRSKREGIVQLKGVGGTKIAFEKQEGQLRQDLVDEGMALLKAAWKQAAGKRKLDKDRIKTDMAAYDTALADKNDKVTIPRLEGENDRRRRPALYQNQALAKQNLDAHELQFDTLVDQIFYDERSNGIFGNQQHINDVDRSTLGKDVRIAFDKAIKEIKQDDRVKKAWRVQRKETTRLTKEKLTADQALLANRTGGLSQVYYDSVSTQIPDEDQLLLASDAFQDGRLSLAGTTITFHKLGESVVVGELKKGTDAYAPAQPQADHTREVFHKKGMEDFTTEDGSPKEYVKDNRDAYTRRYAYVEKNYYQMMEFFMVGHMTGRFQQYMLAGAQRSPNVRTFTTEMIENVPLNKGPLMTDTQVAVAHQMYGSLPEQRGVSLTSTPKVGVTYANTGKNFRTDDGFKLKIDLARIPKDLLLLNHYAEGGVSDTSKVAADYSVKQPHKTPVQDYKYTESAAHARELFLEHIRPEWVVEIEHHTKVTAQDIEGQKAVVREGGTDNLFEHGRTVFGGKDYEQGFEAGLKNANDVPSPHASADYKKGNDTGKEVGKGYLKGQSVNMDKGTVTSDVAFKEIMAEGPLRGEFSSYHIGYAQARTGQPMVTSVQEFRALLNTSI